VHKYSTITRYVSSSPLSGEERRKLFVSYLHVSCPVVPPSHVCPTSSVSNLLSAAPDAPHRSPVATDVEGTYFVFRSSAAGDARHKTGDVGPAIRLQVLGCRATLRTVPVLRLLLLWLLLRVYRVLVGKPEGKRPLGRPRRRWEDNTRGDQKVPRLDL
jgi:hypothetical protein